MGLRCAPAGLEPGVSAFSTWDHGLTVFSAASAATALEPRRLIAPMPSRPPATLPRREWLSLVSRATLDAVLATGEARAGQERRAAKSRGSFSPGDGRTPLEAEMRRRKLFGESGEAIAQVTASGSRLAGSL